MLTVDSNLGTLWVQKEKHAYEEEHKDWKEADRSENKIRICGRSPRGRTTIRVALPEASSKVLEVSQ